MLTRSAWNARRRAEGEPVRESAARDAELDAAMAERGFHVVAPEELPLVEQVRLLRDAEVLVGPSGSALHLAVFAPPGAGVVELGDDRATTAPTPMQRVLDAVSGHRSAFAPQAWSIERLRDELDELVTDPTDRSTT